MISYLVIIFPLTSIFCRILWRGLSLSGSYWIGLSDIATDNDWTWLNGNRGNPNDGSLWQQFYPHSGVAGTNRDCGLLYFGEGVSGLLARDDPLCTSGLTALCEKPV